MAIKWATTTGRGKELEGVPHLRLTKSYISLSDEVMEKLEQVHGSKDFRVQFGVGDEGTIHIRPHNEYGNKVSSTNGINKVQAPGRIEWLKNEGAKEGTYTGKWSEKDGVFDFTLQGKGSVSDDEDANADDENADESKAEAEDNKAEDDKDESKNGADNTRSRSRSSKKEEAVATAAAS